MLYIRKLFTQDLRDGKQIAFPKEPSYSFFSFDYSNKEPDRFISFQFRARFEEFKEYEGKTITTRLYAAGSESRMDGEVKAFIRDELNAKVNDLLIFKNVGTQHINFEFMFVPQYSPFYPLLYKLCGGDNHTIYSLDDRLDESDKCENHSSLPLQQIFYGAPGTGKSNTIKKEVDEKKKTNFRVTFHPDSDYSTFVGAHKPAMEDVETKVVPVVVKSGISLESEGVYKEKKIVYKFIPQAFTKAYTAAWNTEEDVFLIIEEINRGNCAQIFGDLFQLLDRGEDGFSEYPVDSDSDLAEHIAKELSYSPRTDFPEGVKEGKKLVLPKNLYIWATMNTSDQSLFPIDSAFKRRWDWKYIKIKDHPEKSYQIVVGEEERDWYEFIERINDIIASMTSSADKQLGYFFCKADKNGKISAQTFVSKVIFYLWNDVFKDYGFEDTSLFRYVDENDGKEKDLTFPAFYGEDSEEVNETRLKDFLDKVMNWKKDKEEQK